MPKKKTHTLDGSGIASKMLVSAVLLAVVKKSNYLVDTLPSSILEAVWACWHRHLRALLFFWFFVVCFM